MVYGNRKLSPSDLIGEENSIDWELLQRAF